MTGRLKTDEEDIFEDSDVSSESEEDLEGVTPTAMSRAVVWSTDWTAGTIVDQLRKQTIALDPVFQRRDAWTDDRKSRFIESLFLGLPIPQLVLAENNKAKGKFIVIDGKQRLLSLSRFSGVGLTPDQKPLILKGLTVRDELNGLAFQDISQKAKYTNLISEFENQPIRTVVIRGWEDESLLYTIFHRLNTGSVPLSTQELRQALHPGPFLTFAAQFSEESKALQLILGLTKPDFRMRDVELVVRYFSFSRNLSRYRGNLKDFLDTTCDNLNKKWPTAQKDIRASAIQFDEAISAAVKIFTNRDVFRKWDGKRFDRSFNRAVFDVVSTSLTDPRIRNAAIAKRQEVVSAFKTLSVDESFRSSVESTTKSKVAVSTRFSKWYSALGHVIRKKIPLELPPL